MRLALSQAPRRIEIRTSDDPPRARADAGEAAPSAAEALIDLTDAFQAHAFLQQHCAESHALPGLRDFLADEGLAIQRLHDTEVLQQLAARLAGGRLIAVAIEPVRSTPHVATARRASIFSNRRNEADATESPLRSGPQTARAKRGRPADSSADAAPADENDDVDQDAQATTLVIAAKDGTPFCAICELKRALARAAAAETA